ncbi:alcohol dehydrogenase catalytic domain-containing protein [Paeniglutamicibacter sp. MACA_103]|uniref:alcohol dehydrogenase catalytic domain-containing protein n=1 Tax=Paeniglutamicibacter sp. MACA_103 TaxID=3377337 RepID=UPI0038941F0D
MSTSPPASLPLPLTIRGAVLERSDAEAPYATSQPLRVQELTLDAPGPGEILVRIEAASICHSDLSVVDGSRPRPLPMLLGHEAAGIIEQLGDGVEDVQLGQRVVMTFLPRCGDCRGCASNGRMPCEVGSASNGEGTLLSGGQRLHAAGTPIKHHLGISGFATYAVVSRRSVVPVGDDVPADVAALLGCAMLTGGGALINVARPNPTDSVAVIGLGGVGLAALLTARALGVQRIVAIDAQSAKFDTALAMGASAALTPDEALASGERFTVVVEAAGHPLALENGIHLTAPGGITVTVGLPRPGQETRIDPLTLTAEARTIVGSYLGSAVPKIDIPRYEQLWREGKLPVESLISDHIPLDQINDAMDALREGRAIRQIINFPGA